jgi:SAM-dependent methyltransferase
MTYDRQFYDDISADSIASADVIVPRFAELVRPASVVDVGCGRGWFLSKFLDLGVTEILGVDQMPHDQGLAIPEDKYLQHDLCEHPYPIDDVFDLALCLETAEHLPETEADDFVLELVELAPVVLFSAAIPMQGGCGHLNERWPDYWIPKFAMHGYSVSAWPRLELWPDDRVAPYYRQNLLLFVEDSYPANDQLREYVRSSPAFGTWRVVHPAIFGQKLGVDFR